MKKIMIRLIVLFSFVTYFVALSKEHINPDGGEWVTIDSVMAYYEPGSNATSFYQGLSCYDSLNCVGLYGDFLNGYSYSRIRKTTDGGNTWFDIHGDARPPDYPFRRFILYPEKGIIVVGCDSGYVLRSTDGGQNWDYSKKINTLEPKDFMLNSVYMRVKTIIMSYNGRGNVFITKDGGENWSKMQFNTTPKVTNPATFSVIDSNMLIMSSWINMVNDTSMYYFKSTDMGLTWTQINKLQKKDNFYSFFQFLNKNVGYSRHIELIVKGDMLKGTRDTNSTSFYKTTDGGLTWNKFYEIIKQGDGFSKLVVADELNLIATNMQAGYLKTTDGGLTWEMSDYFTYEGEFQGGYHFSNPVFLTPKNPLITSGPRILKYVGKINSVNDKSTNLLKLSPNPATYYITINIESISDCSNFKEESPIASIEIYDVVGMKMQSTPVETKNFSSLQHRIDISNLASGIYFVKIVGSNGACSIVEKFVKI